jgi:hypothetical protein
VNAHSLWAAWTIAANSLWRSPSACFRVAPRAPTAEVLNVFHVFGKPPGPATRSTLTPRSWRALCNELRVIPTAAASAIVSEDSTVPRSAM